MSKYKVVLMGTRRTLVVVGGMRKGLMEELGILRRGRGKSIQDPLGKGILEGLCCAQANASSSSSFGAYSEENDGK